MKPKTPDPLRVEQRRVMTRSAAAVGFCLVMLLGGYVILPRHFDFPSGVSERLVFAIRADLFVFIWVLIGVRMVARGRFRSATDIAGSAFATPSPQLALRVAFLQNTLEQAVVTVGGHLAIATLVHGPALAMIPTAVVLFGIGRVAFLIGYPKGAGGRAFGMVTTSLPTFAAYVWAITVMIVPAWKQ
jgi:hypothetical protein